MTESPFDLDPLSQRYVTLVATLTPSRQDAGDRFAPASDDELLGQFRSGFCEEAEAAFAQLVARHGAIVLGVCRRVLGNEHDAEDAFQATFLVLAKKAGQLRDGRCLPGWLQRVAYRMALRLRCRRGQEQTVDDWDSFPSIESALEQAVARDTLQAIDEELSRLGTVERSIVVLCCFEGLSYAEVAERLGRTHNQIKWGLAKARTSLRIRLARRGFTFSAGMLTALMAHQHAARLVHTLSVSATTKLAVGFTGGTLAGPQVTQAVILATEGLHAMFLYKMKATLLIFALAGTLCVGTIHSFATAGNGKSNRSGDGSGEVASVVPQQDDEEKTNRQRNRRDRRNRELETQLKNEQLVRQELEMQLAQSKSRMAEMQAEMAALHEALAEHQRRAEIEARRAHEALELAEAQRAEALARQEDAEAVRREMMAEMEARQQEIQRTREEAMQERDRALAIQKDQEAWMKTVEDRRRAEEEAADDNVRRELDQIKAMLMELMRSQDPEDREQSSRLERIRDEEHRQMQMMAERQKIAEEQAQVAQDEARRQLALAQQQRLELQQRSEYESVGRRMVEDDLRAALASRDDLMKKLEVEYERQMATRQQLQATLDESKVVQTELQARIAVLQAELESLKKAYEQLRSDK